MFVCNKETYGHLPVPLRAHSTMQDEADSFIHTVLEVNGMFHLYKEEKKHTYALLNVTTSFNFPVRNPPVEPSRYLSKPVKRPDKMGFDEVKCGLIILIDIVLW